MGTSCRGLICRYPSGLKQRQQHADSPDQHFPSIKTKCKSFRSSQSVPRVIKVLLGAISCEDKSSGGCNFCKLGKVP